MCVLVGGGCECGNRRNRAERIGCRKVRCGGRVAGTHIQIHPDAAAAAVPVVVRLDGAGAGAAGSKLKRHDAAQRRGNIDALTTSIICWSVRPNFTDSASDSLATGRSRMLYELSRWFSRRFSCGPWVLSACVCRGQKNSRSSVALGRAHAIHQHSSAKRTY